MSFNSQNMDPRDVETAKWLGGVIDAGDSSASSTAFLPTAALTQNQVTATSAAAKASEGQARTATNNGSAALARAAATGTSSDSLIAPPIVGETRARPATMVTSVTRDSVTTGQQGAARRASKLAAAGAGEAPYSSRQSETYRQSRLSSADAAATLAANKASPSRLSKQRQSELILEKGAANQAATLAARDSAPYEIPEHALSSNAGKAALLAHKDHVEYEVPQHQLSANAGKAALLAHHDHVEYEIPEHELSANAGKAALLAANDHKEYVVPAHKISVNAGAAALLAANNPTSVEVPVHQMSASASSAALLALHDHVEYEVPAHQLSANAGKAALLAHHDHQEYQVPEHTLSANAGKAALLAHRDSTPAPPKVNTTSAAGAASALKAATQAYHDPAMRPTKPEGLQAKGAANALKAASQAHRDRAPAFKYVHPSDDPEIGPLARSNTHSYLAEMQPRDPDENTIKYASMSYNNAKVRQSQADEYRAISDEAYQAAGLFPNASSTNNGVSSAVGRSRTNTASSAKAPVDLMALARRNVDSQMAERGLTRTESQQTVSTIGAAHRGATQAYKDSQARANEPDPGADHILADREISERINREMAQFDQQRKRNQNNVYVQSALMEAAKRNARLSMAQLEADRPYAAPNLRETQRMEDLLNVQKLAAKRDQPSAAMVNLGGGHYMSQIEIEAVAARRIQPVFEEMDEQVAEINRRKAEIQAHREAERQQREAESAERKRLRAEEKEEERRIKEADKKAKAEAKAQEKQRQEELAAQRAEEKRKREDTLLRERRERQERVNAAQSTAVTSANGDTEKVARLTSTDAVATAGIDHDQAPRASVSSRHETPLPGTNVPLPGQEIHSEPASTGDEAIQAEAAGQEDDDDTPDITFVTGARRIALETRNSEHATPQLHRSYTTESATEEIATYQVESQGMVTDTEGETDDEWVDASEVTPAIERAEYVNSKPLTGDNLKTRGGASAIREESTEDAETASISTARPTKVEAASEDSSEIAPPLSKSNGPLHHEHTRFKEELA